MNISKKYYFFVVLIFISMGLLIRLQPNGNSFQPERKAENTSPAPQEYSISVPEEWEEKIDAHNRIDATIDVPDCIRENGFLKATAEIGVVKQNELLSILEDYYHPQKGIEDEQVIQYTGLDNMYLYFFKNNVGGVSLTSTLSDYISMAYREGLTEDYNRDQYPTEEELDNFSIEECDKILYDFCGKVGITGDINITHRTLDYRMLENEAEELHMDGSRTKPNYEWTINDNSYYCTLSQMCNGIGIIPTYYLGYYADILNVGGHTCLLNNERIILFYIDDIYNVQYEEEYEDLMDFPEVLEKYKQYVSIAMQDYDTVVTNITIRVVAINQGNGKYKMTPIWVFYGYWNDLSENSTGYHATFINAITGERL